MSSLCRAVLNPYVINRFREILQQIPDLTQAIHLAQFQNRRTLAVSQEQLAHKSRLVQVVPPKAYEKQIARWIPKVE